MVPWCHTGWGTRKEPLTRSRKSDHGCRDMRPETRRARFEFGDAAMVPWCHAREARLIHPTGPPPPTVTLGEFAQHTTRAPTWASAWQTQRRHGSRALQIRLPPTIHTPPLLFDHPDPPDTLRSCNAHGACTVAIYGYVWAYKLPTPPGPFRRRAVWERANAPA